MAKVKPPRAARQATAGMQTRDVSAEERHRMIAEAAYYRALARGFSGDGDPLGDWLAAEAEIDQMLAARRNRQ